MAQPKLGSTTTYTIEKGVPLPKASESGVRKFPFSEMEVGDSILIPTKSRAAAYSWAHVHGRRFTIRPEGNFARVWRVA